MLLLASLVAGLATTPYAAFHFHRVTPYGVLANLAAMPVVSALVMPAGLLGLVAMPFGFDGLFWAIMGVGIDWMISVTQWVAALPGAVGRVPAFGIGPLIAASLGIILLGLLRTPLRWSGAALVLLAAVWAARVPQPDILISADGRNVGVRGQDGRLHLMHAAKGTRDAFLLREWLAADADPRTATDASLTAGVSCDDHGCVMQSAGGGLHRPGAQARGAGGRLRARGVDRDEQAGARGLRGLRHRCRTAAAAGRDGAAAKPGGICGRGRQSSGIDRPWSPAAADESGAEAMILTRPRGPARHRRDAVGGRPAGGRVGTIAFSSESLPRT